MTETRTVLALAYGLYNLVLGDALLRGDARGIVGVTLAHFVVGGYVAVSEWNHGLDPIARRYEMGFRGMTLALVDGMILGDLGLAARGPAGDSVEFGIGWAMALFANLVCLIDQFTGGV